MKLFLLSIISSLFVNAGALMDREVVIQFSELPVTAQKFLNSNFAGESILSVVYDREIGDKEYYVYYDNGKEVKFDRKGNWTNVECEYSGVPDSVLPKSVLALVKAKHPEKRVTSVSRDLTGADKGYEVELDNMMEMVFDIDGRFIRYDD